MQPQNRQQRTHGIVWLGFRHAENSHDAVPDEADDVTVVRNHVALHDRLEPGEQITCPFRADGFGKPSEAGQIQENDRDLLVQAMLNLARNAVQAVGASGRLTLRSRALTNATIGTERHRVVASLQFEDDGPGVPPELGETIIYPLVTARAGRTGLGLAVAQDIATRHGGIIEFDSRPGRTVFSLLLPMENGHDEAA